MNRTAQPPQRRVELAAGVFAVAPGVLWMRASRTVVAADAHLAYEDVIGGALPTWSTSEVAATLVDAVRSLGARELVLLGDVIHGSRMSQGAADRVRAALGTLREAVELTLVAGNHEGRSRGAAILGETVEWVVRDEWLLLHGDNPPAVPARRAIIGHLHPALRLGGGAAVPAFLFGNSLIVLPAMTPYSDGLDACSEECLHALGALGVGSRRELSLVAATRDWLYPFGNLADYNRAVHGRSLPPRSRYHRRTLRPDR